MKLKIEIDTGNAAFGDNDVADRNAELSRILVQLSKRLELTNETSAMLYDFNGNRVGTWKIE